MQYLLDSNIISYLEDSDSPFSDSVYTHLLRLPDEARVTISILSLYEFNYGISHAMDDSPDFSAELQRIRASVLDSFPLVPLSMQGAEIFGLLKAAYRKATGAGSKELDRHTVDFIIASTALETGAVLVSNDQIFARMQEVWPELKLENWVVAP